ncbi:hypothetical protein HPB50_011366 [Hyalomma asiaticum]|uniref:Uncharacterized protein n=1 Tax=Hyalomma asiaticum TaxID=266040 RepID=A0ACB7RP59_HYAAI|nr:hypothetical protein HPB50_011366 [Hyalomma asiaticum]
MIHRQRHPPSDEIASLVKDVERKYPKLISQQVPRHMRRRTGSMAEGNEFIRLGNAARPAQEQRPSRKHRRGHGTCWPSMRVVNGATSGSRPHLARQAFQDGRPWGYRVPLHPTDKGIRAAYRGSAKHVLLHDVSYYNCVELIGSAETLVSKLALLTNADAVQRVSAAIAARGKHDLRSGVESNLVRRAAPSAPLSCTAAVAAAGAESTASASLGATDSVVVTLSDRAPKPAVVSVATLPSRFAELVSGTKFLIAVRHSARLSSAPVYFKMAAVCFGQKQPRQARTNEKPPFCHVCATGQ